jgi:hypothetical protein
MSRGGMKITRVDGDYEYARGSAAPRWLEEFAAKVEDKPRTAVEVSRDRAPSFVDRINAIMGGGAGRMSPYSSVEEAVQDYQKRTGLLDYQKMAMAQEIVEAGLSAEAEEDADADKKSDKPEILKRFPALETYIRNTVETQHGIQLPAIIHGVLETFGRDIKESDIDSELYHWINDMLKDKLSDQQQDNDFALGRGIGTEPTSYELNDGNRDPFINLMPKRLV